MVTRDDVARRAGVSASTVSYVISGRRPISEATRDRVLEAMRALDYTPNAFARGLAGSRGGIFALHYPYSPQGLSVTEFEYVASAANAARARGYHLLLWSNPIDDLTGLRGLVNERLVDGVVLMEVQPKDARIEVLRDAGTPFATIGRPVDEDAIPFVDDDFDSLVRQAVDHLADQGHERVAFLHATQASYGRGRGPLRRMRDALGTYAPRRGLDVASLAADQTIHGGHDAYALFADVEPRATALISFNEAALPGFLAAAATDRVRVPADLAVVALSIADSVAEASVPPLTSVAPPATVLAERAVEILADAVEGRSTTVRQVLVAPTLTVRDSSRRGA